MALYTPRIGRLRRPLGIIVGGARVSVGSLIRTTNCKRQKYQRYDFIAKLL